MKFFLKKGQIIKLFIIVFLSHNIKHDLLANNNVYNKNHKNRSPNVTKDEGKYENLGTQYDTDTDRYYAVPTNKKISSSRARLNEQSSINQVNPHFILISNYKEKRDRIGVDIVDVNNKVGRQIQKEYDEGKKLLALNKDKKVFLKKESIPDISSINVNKDEIKTNSGKGNKNPVKRKDVKKTKKTFAKTGNKKFLHIGGGLGILNQLVMKGKEQPQSISGDDNVIETYKLDANNFSSYDIFIGRGVPFLSSIGKNMYHEFQLSYGTLENSGNIDANWIYAGNYNFTINDLSTKLIGSSYSSMYLLSTPTRLDFFIGAGVNVYNAQSANDFLNSAILTGYHFKAGFDFHVNDKLKIATYYKLQMISGNIGNNAQVPDPSGSLTDNRPLQVNESSFELTRHSIEIAFKFY